jgi:lipopolysaccharide export system protein LptA
MKTTRYVPVLGAAALLVTAGATMTPLFGQGSSQKARNGNAPVTWEADRVEVQDTANRVFLTGNVIATQQNLTMRAARVTVAYTNAGGAGDNNVDVHRLDASGGVTLHTPSETAQGNFATYDVDRRIVTMIGGVHLTQGTNRVQGGRLVLDLNTHRAVMDGGGGSTGRVSGVFSVPRRQQAATPATGSSH